MINVLFISHSSQLAGAERCLLDILSGLDRNRFSATVVVPADGPLVSSVKECGWEVVIAPLRIWLVPERNFREFDNVFRCLHKRVSVLNRIIAGDEYDVVYTNSLAVIEGAVAAKLCGIPHVWHIHELLNNHLNLKSFLPLPVLSVFIAFLSDQLLFPSNVACNLLSSPFTTGKSHVVYTGMHMRDSDSGTSCSIREEYGINRQTKVIAIIGSIIPIKGHTDFIRAAEQVIRQYDDCVFVVIGTATPEYETELMDLIEELKLGDRIIFIGQRNDVDRIYRQVDLLVSASWVESSSRVIAEAMMHGVPVVATRSGGPEELVIDGVTGYLVPIHDPSALAGAIVRILNTKDLSEMKRAAMHAAKSKHDHRAYVHAIEQVIESSVNK